MDNKRHWTRCLRTKCREVGLLTVVRSGQPSPGPRRTGAEHGRRAGDRGRPLRGAESRRSCLATPPSLLRSTRGSTRRGPAHPKRRTPLGTKRTQVNAVIYIYIFFLWKNCRNRPTCQNNREKLNVGEYTVQRVSPDTESRT